MNIERARLPRHRSYNWRIWYCKHRRCIRLFILCLFVGLVLAAGEWLMHHYLGFLEDRFQARAESAQAMSLRMSGAPKTPEDSIRFQEPVGWKMAYNWEKLGFERRE